MPSRSSDPGRDIGPACHRSVHPASIPRPEAPGERLPLTGHRSAAYWSEAGKDRTELLGRALAILDEHRWGRVLDTGWFEWDLAVYCGSGLILRVVTAQEEHGQGKRLIRIRYRLAPTARLGVICAVSIVALAVVALTYPRVAMGAAVLVLGLGVRAWVRGPGRGGAGDRPVPRPGPRDSPDRLSGRDPTSIRPRGLSR